MDIASFFNNLPDNYTKYFSYLHYIPIFFLISFGFTPLWGKIAKAFNIYDFPAHERNKKKSLNKYDDPSRHIHKKKVPFLGGLAVTLPFILSLFMLSGENKELLIPFTIGTLILVIAGFIDDAFNFPSIIQFLIQIIAASLIAFSIADFATVALPFNIVLDLDWFSFSSNIFNIGISFVFPGDFIILFWILVCINAVKWMGGSDGLLESNCIIALMLFYILSIRDFNFLASFFSVQLIGSMTGFLFFNFPPAKIYTGGTGKSVYGYIMAVLAILSGAKVATALIILTLPIIDFTYVIIKRYITYKPKNPIELLRINSKDHLHHKLLDLGFSPKRVILIETLAILIIGSIGFLAVGANRFFIIILLAFLGLGSLFVLDRIRAKKLQDRKEKPKDETPESKYSY